MAKLTPFGMELRKLRIEKDMRLLDLASALQKSAAFISAVETGKKPIPDGLVRQVSHAMNLTAEQIRQLRMAADRTRTEVNVQRLSPEKRELTAAFARRLEESPTFFEQIRMRVLKSCDDEVPFTRKRRGICVPPISNIRLETIAERVRSIYCREDDPYIDIMRIIEFEFGKADDFILEIGSIEEMGRDEGRVMPGDITLTLREDVYYGACRGDARPRFTVCHELGHFLLHRQAVGFPRSRQDDDPIYCDAEWQADSFAGFLMLSRRHASVFRTAEEASGRCGMSVQAATVMLAKHGRRAA